MGSIGEEEEWKVLYEKENEPEAQVLEVPNLTPFTHYRSVMFLFTSTHYFHLFYLNRNTFQMSIIK